MNPFALPVVLLALSSQARQDVVGPTYRFGDFDRDGLLDVYVVRPSAGDRLYKNLGDGTFVDVSAAVGLSGVTGSRLALWQDFDGDGWLDLYVGAQSGRSRLLHNEHGASFVDVTVASGVAHRDGAELFAEWIDFDLDGWTDLHVVTEQGDHLWRNVAGHFEAVALPAASELDAAVIALQLATLNPTPSSTALGAADEDAGTSTGGPQALGVRCPQQVKDQATGNCLFASTNPALGQLYPLSANLNVSAAGNVGIGTTSPGTKLDVSGDVRASGKLVSSAISGAPLLVSSTAKVTNLNADLLDGLDSSSFTQLGNSIEGGEISAGTITSANLAAGAVTSAKLAASAVTSSLIADGTITGADIAVGAVGSAQIADGSVGFADIATGAVTTGQILDGTITGADVATHAIDAGNLANPISGQVSIDQSASAYTTNISNSGTSGIRDCLRCQAYSGSAYALWTVNNATTNTAYAMRAQSDSTIGRACFGEATTTGATVAYGVFGECHNTAAYGVYASGDFGGTGAKYFIQPHPTDPSKQINFACLEGNESGTYFRGSVQIVGGVGYVDVPEDFRLVTEPDSLTATATAVGAPALVWVESQALDRVVLRANLDVKVNYVVNGTRRGFRELETIRENTSFVPEYRGLPFGLQYRPEQRALLVQSGILNADFTPNEATAKQLGWELKDPWNDEHAEPLVRELLRAGLVVAPAGWIAPSQR